MPGFTPGRRWQPAYSPFQSGLALLLESGLSGLARTEEGQRRRAILSDKSGLRR